ncbi:unnamed protein product [Anisakis simplex]|uniref:Uncharacterized protein n=1 Tax=Anisakis simplex TaxID=6269 RepID=A0A0M3KG18_ANISI|nr:unnamed protein product [Anisakis simplex]
MDPRKSSSLRCKVTDNVQKLENNPEKVRMCVHLQLRPIVSHETPSIETNCFMHDSEGISSTIRLVT